MPELPPSDLRHLEAAVGWIELGSHVDANVELEEITAHLRAHPDVLGVRWQVYAMEGKWDACVDITETIIKLDPNRLAAWIDRATAIRQANSGGLKAAYDSLLPALEQFPGEPLVPFTLARFACQLGRPDNACDFLRRTFVVAAKSNQKKRFRLMALDEPDLEPLWARIGEIGK